jgi:hypothetical protein
MHLAVGRIDIFPRVARIREEPTANLVHLEMTAFQARR